VVVAAHPDSIWSAILAPGQAAVLALAVVFLVAAAIGLARARRESARVLAAEQRARAEAERLSRIDPLTGLYNRRHIAETIEHELDRAARQGRAVGILMFDIDYFKRVNDAHGHSGGDAVLVEVGRRLQKSVRSWDVVARVGGEEFCVVAPEVADEAAVLDLGQRLREAIKDRAITVREGLAIPVTVSLGVAFLHDPASAEHAFDCADRALYAAKRRGRDRICCYSELDHTDLRAEQPECLHLAEALAAAGDLREGLTVDHSREMAALAAEVALALGLDEDEVLRARLGGWLHDVGKLSVPDGVLGKIGPLTVEEWETIRAHAAVGAELIRTFPELALAAEAVRHHHERWDGHGYPDGLAGDAIPLEARIVAAVDAYHAMLSARPYRPARTHAEAVEELRRCAGAQFDPAVVDALFGVLPSRGTPAELATI
jgi:diguanylate cyclase (GGDEF)-like protein/putative nucleotidyltransferase with HDIG domain